MDWTGQDRIGQDRKGFILVRYWSGEDWIGMDGNGWEWNRLERIGKDWKGFILSIRNDRFYKHCA